MLAGRYELLEVIGRGGMGVVHRARDVVLGRTVAVKLLSQSYSGDAAAVARFEREARSAGALHHPNIVAVFDRGRDGESRYIVMEWVQGEDLAHLLARRGSLGFSEASALGAQVAAALHAAHRRGIVHRDVKPANVMIDGGGTVKMLDFGIAKAVAGGTLTGTATVVGSAVYMAPESARGRPAGPRSDVYSLGCVLYEMLTGRPPFRGETFAHLIYQHMYATPRPLRTLRREVPQELDALVTEMLCKEPAKRPASAAEVRDRLHASCSHGPLSRSRIAARGAQSGAPTMRARSHSHGRRAARPATPAPARTPGRRAQARPETQRAGRHGATLDGAGSRHGARLAAALALLGVTVLVAGATVIAFTGTGPQAPASGGPTSMRRTADTQRTAGAQRVGAGKRSPATGSAARALADAISQVGAAVGHAGEALAPAGGSSEPIAPAGPEPVTQATAEAEAAEAETAEAEATEGEAAEAEAAETEAAEAEAAETEAAEAGAHARGAEARRFPVAEREASKGGSGPAGGPAAGSEGAAKRESGGAERSKPAEGDRSTAGRNDVPSDAPPGNRGAPGLTGGTPPGNGGAPEQGGAPEGHGGTPPGRKAPPPGRLLIDAVASTG